MLRKKVVSVGSLRGPKREGLSQSAPVIILYDSQSNYSKPRRCWKLAEVGAGGASVAGSWRRRRQCAKCTNLHSYRHEARVTHVWMNPTCSSERKMTRYTCWKIVIRCVMLLEVGAGAASLQNVSSWFMHQHTYYRCVSRMFVWILPVHPKERWPVTRNGRL